MKYIKVEGLDQKCSQIVLGTTMLSPDNMDFVSELLDTFVEQGGNTLDTAHLYHAGCSEKAIGLWLKKRKKRDDIIIIDKGAHPEAKGPRVTPEAIEKDLHESLDRLQVDFIDIYMLHRDDPSIPVDLIVDTLNEHRKAGFIRVLGVSNWTNDRIEQANKYAKSKGLAPFTVNSPNLSLAKPNEPMWPGCISVDMESLMWHKKHQLLLFSWSSQAGGFFTGRYTPESNDDAEMVRVYYNDNNWERMRRAEQLGKEKGASPNQIALAYVLNQSFPTCAIIGPHHTSELHSSLNAVKIDLGPDELRWLDLQDE